MQVERKHVDDQRDDDQTDHTENQMRTELNLGHFQITEFVPKVFDRVETDKRRAEHADPLDTAHATDRNTSGHEPETPFGSEGITSLVVELGPAEHRGESEEQQHTVQQDEAADRGITVLEQDHHRHQPDRRLLEMQLFRGVVGEGYAERAESGIELAHEGVVEFLGVGLARLELERAIVPCEITGETHEHLAERRVDIEVEFTLEVVGAEFAKMRFIPGDNGGEADLPQTCEEREQREKNGGDQVFIVIEGLQKGVRLDVVCQSRSHLDIMMLFRPSSIILTYFDLCLLIQLVVQLFGDVVPVRLRALRRSPSPQITLYVCACR
nr:hypothetical protein CFP56_64118 [Quercus suber]